MPMEMLEMISIITPNTTARLSLEYPFCHCNLAIDTRFRIELAPRYNIGINIPRILYLATPKTFTEMMVASKKRTKAEINAIRCRLITTTSLIAGLLMVSMFFREYQ